MLIGRELLQEICERVAQGSDADVSVCERDGSVVASSRRSELGRRDAAAAEIVAGNADATEIPPVAPGASAYCAQAIEVDGERPMCVVVTGPLESARRLGAIVKHWVISLLRSAKAEAEHERILEQSEQRFRDVAESAGDWIWEMDADLRFTYESPRFFEIFPVAPERIIGKT
ncbi:MAG TPA: sugar diacid recognition domain-containing protein, partial [Alphaproteobacteria bacterium]|nr:sugar diacid recognition domain-containing protein [Alphaproteobacteria bacterium]